MMIAKFQVSDVIVTGSGSTTSPSDKTTAEEIKMRAVTDKPFNMGGTSDDNSFAKWTPFGELKIVVTNPDLFGRIVVGQKYYLNFTPAADSDIAPKQ